MPVTSAQMSGLIGGQMAMFSNQAALSQQIAGTYGTGPPVAGGMQNPYPSMPSYGMSDWGQSNAGARIAGGAAMALPGIATGIGIAGGVMGGAMGWLDPFTGVSRGFAAGAGIGGKGFFGGIGALGRTFASGGLRAGLGAVGGGLAAALPLAGMYYAAGKGIETVATNLYQGVQNIQDVQGMANQYFEPQWGRGGMGGATPRGVAKNITSFMHELASEDVMTSMRDMRQLMDRAGQMGMLSGVFDAQSFKQRFRKIVDQTKTVAQILGTSLEDAMPMLGEMQRMGMWTAADVMGTTVAAKAAGPGAAPHLMGAMQTGAQISHAMGGRLQAGALLGRQLFGQVNAAVGSGLLTREQLMEYTGGVGGAQGQQMVAGSMQRIMSGFGESSMGRLMMAGLGEMKEGRFTGRMDEERLSRFMRGEIDVGQLQREGRARVRSRESAVSFHNRAAEMGQSMIAQAGMGGMATAVQQVMERAGYGGAGEEIQNRFIQMMMKVGTRDADMIQKMMRDMPRMQAEQARRLDAAFEDSVRRLDVRRNRSWQGFKDAVGHIWEETIERPIQEFAEGVTTRMGEDIDDLTGRLTGRIRQMPRMGFEHQMRLRMQTQGRPAVSLAQLGVTNQYQDFVDPGTFANTMMRLRQPGEARRVGMSALMQVSGPVGAIGAGIADIARYASRQGSEGLGLNVDELAGMTPRARLLMQQGLQAQRGTAGADEVNLGGGMKASSRDVRRLAELTIQRAMGRSLVSVNTDERQKAMGVVQSRIRELFNTQASSKSLRELREKDPEAYNIELVKRLKQGAGVKEAMRTLGQGSEFSGIDLDLNILAQAQTDMGYGGGEHAADFRRAASELGAIVGDRTDLDRIQAKNAEEIRDLVANEAATPLRQVLKGGVATAVAGLGAVAGPLGAIALPFLGEAAADTIMAGLGMGEISRTQIEQALTAEEYTPEDIIAYVKRGGAGNAFAEAASRGNQNAAALQRAIDSGSPEFKKNLEKKLGRTTLVQLAEMDVEMMERMRKLTKGQGIDRIAGVRGGITERIEDIRGQFAGAKTVGQTREAAEAITSLARTGGFTGGEIKQLLAGRGGVVGRQVGREALIQQTFAEGAKITEKDLRQFERQMRSSGVNVMNEQVQKEIADALKGDKMIKGEEVGKLRKVLEATVPSALGRGAAGRTTQDQMLQLMTSYTQANRDFVFAVATAVPALQEVKPDAYKKIVEESNKMNATEA